MPRKRYKPEEIVAKLRQVDVLVSQGQSMADAIRQIGVSEVIFYRWRQEFGGLKIEQVKRLKDLELENSRLRKAVSDLTLDKLILQEAPGEITEPRASSRLHRAYPRAIVGQFGSDVAAKAAIRARSYQRSIGAMPVSDSMFGNRSASRMEYRRTNQ